MDVLLLLLLLLEMLLLEEDVKELALVVPVDEVLRVLVLAAPPEDPEAAADVEVVRALAEPVVDEVEAEIPEMDEAGEEEDVAPTELCEDVAWVLEAVALDVEREPTVAVDPESSTLKV